MSPSERLILKAYERRLRAFAYCADVGFAMHEACMSAAERCGVSARRVRSILAREGRRR